MSDYPRLDDNGLLYYTQEIKKKIDASVPPDMIGASASTNGSHGLAPQPNAGQESLFLRGDGVWAEPSGTPNTIESISVNNTPITPDANKNVNIPVPTTTSELTNNSDFQTGTQVQSAIESQISKTLKPSGSILFANLPSLTAENCNKIFDIQDSFTTTADFLEGAGETYPAHTNVAIIDNGSGTSHSYKYDTYGSLIDMSGVVLSSEMTTISNSEIDDIIDAAFNPSSNG